MGDAYRNGKYSRDEGVSNYVRRRRRSLGLRVFAAVVLVTIIGGASYLFGKQFIDPDSVPFDLLGLSGDAASASDDAQAQAPSTVQPANISLVAAGEVVAEGSVVDSGRLEGAGYDFSHLLSRLTGELAGFDLRIVEQETNVAGDYDLLDAIARAERDAGFTVVLRANDHAFDGGDDGMHDELQWWHDNMPEISVLGVADPNPEDNPALPNYASSVYVYEKDGFKVAVLNHTIDANDAHGAVSQLTEEKIAADVAQAREQGAQMIVACPHWGEENNADVTEEQTRFAWYYASQGVDVILGTHPRVLQRVEVLQTGEGHKTVCFYSLGSLVTSAMDNNLLGGLAEVQLARNDQGTCEVTSAVLKPVITHRGNGTEYGTYLLRDYSNEILWSGWDGWPNIDEWNSRLWGTLGEGYDAEAREYRVNLDAVVQQEVAEPTPEAPDAAVEEL